MIARELAILDLPHHGNHPPPVSHRDYDPLLAEWAQRCRVRFAAARRLLDAVAALDAVEPCPPSP